MITHTAINFGRGAQTIGNVHRWPTVEICAERAVCTNANANTHTHTHTHTRTQQQAIQRGPSTGFICADISQQPKTLGSRQGGLQTRGYVHREHQGASVNNKDLHTEGSNQGFLCAGSFCVCGAFFVQICFVLGPVCAGSFCVRGLLYAVFLFWALFVQIYSHLGPLCADSFFYGVYKEGFGTSL